MSNVRYAVQRNIHGHLMFYCDIALDICPSWVDEPTSAILFPDHYSAERVVNALSANDNGPFPITIIPVRLAEDDDEEET